MDAYGRQVAQPDEFRGYADRQYAHSFAEFGVPAHLPTCDGWLLTRPIPNSGLFDSSGLYPFFSCRDWHGLPSDLAAHQNNVVSTVIVTDPLMDADCIGGLSEVFDVAPYKKHFLVDLSLQRDDGISAHHLRCARNGLRKVTVELCQPHAILDDWCRLYQHIVQRHQIVGIRAFSRNSFDRQLRVPGATLFAAYDHGKLIGLHWYLITNDVVYAHLAALDPVAYRLSASYALHYSAIEHFRGKYRWLVLGSAPDPTNARGTGLWEFKQGWASSTVQNYLVRIMGNASQYEQLVRAGAQEPTGYFPAYRAPSE